LRRGRLNLRLGLPRVGVEAKLVVANPDHITAIQELLPLNPVAVYEAPVCAAVDQQIALRAFDDLGMPTRHIPIRENDVTIGRTANNQGSTANGVFPSIGEGDEPTTSRTPAASRPSRAARGRKRAVVDVHELRASAPPLVAKPELVSTDHHLVPVEQRRWLGAHPDPIDQHVDGVVGFINGNLTIGCGPDEGVSWRDIDAAEHDLPSRITTDGHFPCLDGVAAAAYFQI
jgi:hypothetical protein